MATYEEVSVNNKQILLNNFSHRHGYLDLTVFVQNKCNYQGHTVSRN
jgi:hypothetical protein